MLIIMMQAIGKSNIDKNKGNTKKCQELFTEESQFVSEICCRFL